jgi:hypothetical protein
MLKSWLVVGLMVGGCLPVGAQRPDLIGVIIPSPLSSYLELTSSQMTQLDLNWRDFNRVVSERQERIYQVQSEIRDETSKSPLNPGALGIRYAEIESICRNARDEAAATQKRNLALLTDPQRAKLKALDEASKLLPVINEAHSVGLLAPPAPSGFPGTIIPANRISAAFILGIPAAAAISGCQQFSDFRLGSIPTQLN